MKKKLKYGILVFIAMILFGGSQTNAQDFKISTSTNIIYEKQKLKIKAKPSIKQTGIIWKISDQKIAVVSKKGIVTGKRAGKVKIYAVSANNHQKKQS